MHGIERIRTEPSRGDAWESVARWENEGGACDERELVSPRPASGVLTTEMASGEHVNEAPGP